MRRIISASLLLFVTASGALAWETRYDDGRLYTARDVAVDAAGDAIWVGHTDASSLIAAKLNGATGVELWRYTLDPGGVFPDAEGLALALDGASDVIVAGRLDNGLAAVKLSGATGGESWRYELADGLGQANVVSVDSAGDVIVAGVTNGTAPPYYTGDLVVVKLAGATGTQLWRYDLSGAGHAGGIAVDGSDDVVVGSSALTSGRLVKLAGGTGAELWQSPMAMTWLNALAADSTGDVVVGGIGNGSGAAAVVKLAAADGSELWDYVIGDALAFDGAAAVAIDAAGDVFVGGITSAPELFKLSGATGTELWRVPVPQAASQIGRVAIDGSGDVVAVAGLGFSDPRDNLDFVVKHAGDTGEEIWRARGGGSLALGTGGFVVTALTGDFSSAKGQNVYVAAPTGRLSGRKLIVSDGGPSARKITLVSKDTMGILPASGTPGDPTTAGATVEIINPGTSESDTFVLPAGYWSVLLGGGIVKGYRYADPSHAAGPCKKILIKKQRAMKVLCDGAGIAFSLDESSQGALAVRLRTGAGVGAIEHCALFGGSILDDVPGSFRAVDAPPPATCP